jgi:hypothetical protein
VGLLKNILEKAGIRCQELNEQMAQTIPSSPFQAEFGLLTKGIMLVRRLCWLNGRTRRTQQAVLGHVPVAARSWAARSLNVGNVAPVEMSLAEMLRQSLFEKGNFYAYQFYFIGKAAILQRDGEPAARIVGGKFDAGGIQSRRSDSDSRGFRQPLPSYLGRGSGFDIARFGR